MAKGNPKKPRRKNSSTPKKPPPRRRKKPAAPKRPRDPATRYAKRVVSGKIVAGPHVRDACKRHLDDLNNGAARGLTWDIEAAQRALDFFPEVLRLNGGKFEGLPFELMPEQEFIVGSLFGWKGPDGFRRFRMAFIEEAKGNGKSPLAAGIGLYLQTADGEPRAEIYAAAQKKDQAKVLFRDAIAMVEQSPDLAERVILSGGVEKTNIAYLKTGSFFRPISTEDRGKGQSGPRVHGGLLDEIHEHATNAMVEFLTAGTKGRNQAMIVMITNSGSDRESVCYDYHDYGAKVCSGALADDSFFAYICALDEGDDPFENEKCWIKVNPALGVTVTLKYLREQVRQARGMPSKQNLVKRLNFCIWTDAQNAWISKDVWDPCCAMLDRAEYKARACHGGLDLSAKKDLTALALAFEPDENGIIDAFLQFWTPLDTMKDREEADRVPYSSWVEAGHLTAVPGKSIDYAYVAKFIGETTGEFDFKDLAYDRWRIDDLLRELDAEGVDAWKETDKYEGIGLKLVEHGQGFKDMSPALDDIEEAILNGTLRVHINPVLTWNVASVMLEEDAAGNRKFTKRKSTGRIDGIVALAMAVRHAAAANERSIYEADDFFI